jgi:hypothetical protein
LYALVLEANKMNGIDTKVIIEINNLHVPTHVPLHVPQIKPESPLIQLCYKINIVSTVSGHVETIYAYVDPISQLFNIEVVNSILNFVMTNLIPEFVKEQEIVDALLSIQNAKK